MKYLKAELEEILKKHNQWINDEDGGCRADLCGADLCGASLCDADLRGADLCGADLCGADLRDADLRDADLRRASLCDADLRRADLRDADLRDADLRRADLRGADLCGADLDFSMLHFSCKSLHTKFSQKIIVQILYHAAIPTQSNYIDLDPETRELFESDAFKKVVNKFHRLNECGIFNGPLKIKSE